MIKRSMKKLFVLCMCSIALAGSLFAQVPTDTPIASPTAATAATAATMAAPIAAPASTATRAPRATSNSASSDHADKIYQKPEKKLGRKRGSTLDTTNNKDPRLAK